MAGPRLILPNAFSICCQHLVGFERADGDGHRIVGRVIRAIMVVQIVARHRLQIAQMADRFVAVTVRAERGRLHFFAQQLARTILAALLFADDDGALGGYVARAEGGVHHPIGFQRQPQFDLFGGQRFEVGGEVQPREAVPLAAFARDDSDRPCGREISRCP